MAPRPPLLDPAAVTGALETLDGWTGDPAGLERTVECASFPAAIALVVAVADVAEEMDHHPDIDLRWRRVDLSLATHSAGGVTAKDIELAAALDEIAAQLPQHHK